MTRGARFEHIQDSREGTRPTSALLKLRASQDFTFRHREPLHIEGTIKHEQSHEDEPDQAEQLARALAARAGWPIDEAS